MKKTIILTLCCMAAMVAMAQNHEYVDMGRAGLWATCNIGAAKPEDAGEYFQWKDNRKEGVKVYKPGDGSNFDYERDKRECHDYATEAWGGVWRMPTWQEMMVLTSYKWEWDEARNGWLVTMDKEWDPDTQKTNVIENGNSIFLPAAGYYNEKGEKVSTKQLGKYWASSVMYYQPDDAWTLLFGNLGHVVVDDNQKIRCTIRPVLGDFIESLSFAEKSIIMGTGQEKKLECQLKPTNPTNPHLQWSSSNVSIVMVNEKGYVNALKEGTCIITAMSTDGSNQTASCEITVKSLENGDGTINEHAFVNLGLPSGTKWASCNIGASKPSEEGERYAWGETNTKSEFDWSDYLGMASFKDCGTDKDPLKEYLYPNNKSIAGTEFDVAHFKWGNTWMMPTIEHFDELKDANYTSWEWTNVNGVSGIMITSKINSNVLFFPATNYWTAMSYGEDVNDAYSLYLTASYGIDYMGSLRYQGFSIRPVTK